MSQSDVIAICKDALMTALIVSAPILIVSIVIGMVISVFQAATQIHEQTMTFVPKIIAIAFVPLFTGSWMITLLMDFTQRLFESIPNYL
jgi:flagellar biosynthetic protein FliQ